MCVIGMGLKIIQDIYSIQPLKKSALNEFFLQKLTKRHEKG